MDQIHGPPGNQDYFRRRESQERWLAAHAGDRAARCVHLRMAERYASLIREESLVAYVPGPV